MLHLFHLSPSRYLGVTNNRPTTPGGIVLVTRLPCFLYYNPSSEAVIMIAEEMIHPFPFRRFSLSGHQVTRWFLRASIYGLQVVGSFPYTWSGPPHPPHFNLGLCLWTIFIRGFMSVGLYLHVYTDKLISKYLTDYGAEEQFSIVFIYANSIVIYVTSLLTLMNSRKLAKLLSNLREPVGRNNDLTGWSSLASFLPSLVQASVLIITYANYYANNRYQLSMTQRLVQIISASLATVGYISTTQLFKAVARTLSSHLVESTREALSPTSSEIEDPMLLLEKQVRKVSEAV